MTGRYVRLERLTIEHVDALVEAASEDRTAYGYTAVVQNHNDAEAYVEWMTSMWESGDVVPFVQIDVERNLVVGTTRYLTIRRVEGRSLPYAVEIGGTWLSASAQRTAINTNAKFLLLDYAFTNWGVSRVDLKTDARNERSRCRHRTYRGNSRGSIASLAAFPWCQGKRGCSATRRCIRSPTTSGPPFANA